MLGISLTQLSWLDLIVTSVTLVAVPLIASVVYNLYFHPLSHIPGPRVCAASEIPSYVHALRGDRHIWLWQLFETYGNKVRVGPNLVLWRDPQAFADIYGLKSNVQRSKFYVAWKRNDDDKTVMTAVDYHEHAAKRKILNLAFTEKSVRAASDFVIKNVDRWHELLLAKNKQKDNWSPAINLAHELDTLIFDIMGDVTFGSSFDIKEPGENKLKEVPILIAQYLKFYYPIARSPIVNLFCWLKPRGIDQIFQSITPPSVQAYYKFVHDSVSQRLVLHKKQASLPEHDRQQDMMYFLAEAKNPDTGLPAYDEATIQSESVLLIIAGSDTTAISLKGIFFYLTGDPGRLEKLTQEIRAAFPSAEDIIYGPKLLNLPYMRACIDEGMRLTPSGPCELPREVRPGGLVVKGDFIPAGTIVGTVPFCNSRNDSIYGDSGVFRPERWMVDEATGVTKESVAALRANFHPFLSGPGACVGKGLAMAEMMIVLARTLHRFDIRREPGSKLGCGGPKDPWGSTDDKILSFQDTFVSVIEGPSIQWKERAA
ncbi:Cytochrome P450 monooxygenase AKT7 [Paramyrothecium foliicola]|nr:Cytochrome P450 monooxygenase AKT7 [Paramyrothecium foliicola]